MPDTDFRFGHLNALTKSKKPDVSETELSVKVVTSKYALRNSDTGDLASMPYICDQLS